MMRLLPVLFFLLTTSWAFGQGTIRGKVSDQTGETLIGASIALKAQPTKAVGTDYDGNYSLSITDTVPTTIVVSYFGYRAQETVVHPRKGEVVILNFILVQESYAFFVPSYQSRAIDMRRGHRRRWFKSGHANINAPIEAAVQIEFQGAHLPDVPITDHDRVVWIVHDNIGPIDL